MTTQYLYDKQGFLSGITESTDFYENSTTIPPIYTDGFIPQFINGAWVDNTVLPMLSPVEFKLMFTAEERIAIKASIDPLVQDFFELLNDLIADPRKPYIDRNLKVVSDAIKYLESKALIGTGRAVEILS